MDHVYRNWLQVLLWTLMYLVRWSWINIYPVLALAAGLVFVVCVPQARDLLANLRADPWIGHGAFFFAALGAWSATLWYAMRLLSSRKFPGDVMPHPASAKAEDWINLELPRLAPTAGLMAIACASSIFLGDPPSGRWIMLLAAGLVPLAWAFAWAGDRLLRKKIEERLPLAHPLALALCVLFAGVLGLYAWWRAPISENLFEAKMLGWQIAALATLVLSVPGLRRGKGDGWMLVASVLWVGSAAAAVVWGDGFGLPGLFVAGAAFGLWWVARRRQLYHLGASPRIIKWLRLERGTVYAVAVSLVVLVGLAFGFSQAPIALGGWLGTLAIVFVALAIWSFFGSLWVLFPKLWGLPSLAVVPILWLAFLGSAPDHSLRDTRYAKADRPPIEKHFEQWQNEAPRGGPIIFVAAAGGGLRAAYWTASVLAAADDATCGEFGRHVYAYSGVSGGSLGIAAYLAQREAGAADGKRDEHCRSGSMHKVQQMLREDFLAPVAGSMLFAELWQRFAHTPLDNDRGTTLAKAWSSAWDRTFPEHKGRFDQPFLSQFAPYDARNHALPAVFLNATAVDSGRRAVASNVLHRIPSAHDLFAHRDRVKLKTAGLTVREAVLNSARFTYVSPAGTVHGCFNESNAEECKERIWDRVVDGGYFENSGVATLSDVLEAALPGDKRYLKRIFVIVIDNSSAPELVCARGALRDADGRAEELPPLSGVTTPLETFLNVREARAGLEVRRLRRAYPCDPHLIEWSLAPDKHEREQPPLGWFLSQRSENLMKERLKALAAEMPFHVDGCSTTPKSRASLGVGGERACPAP
jgi:hypothetical protein